MNATSDYTLSVQYSLIGLLFLYNGGLQQRHLTSHLTRIIFLSVYFYFYFYIYFESWRKCSNTVTSPCVICNVCLFVSVRVLLHSHSYEVKFVQERGVARLWDVAKCDFLVPRKPASALDVVHPQGKGKGSLQMNIEAANDV